MLRSLTEHFCDYYYYSCVILDGTITALKSTIGKNLIIGDLVHVCTRKIPDSRSKLFEVIKIDLKDGISVRNFEDREKIYVLNTEEILVFWM